MRRLDPLLARLLLLLGALSLCLPAGTTLGWCLCARVEPAGSAPCARACCETASGPERSEPGNEGRMTSVDRACPGCTRLSTSDHGHPCPTAGAPLELSAPLALGLPQLDSWQALGRTATLRAQDRGPPVPGASRLRLPLRI